MRDQIEISKGIDWLMVWLYVILVSIGILCIYSVEYRQDESFFNTVFSLNKNYSRQLLFAVICGIVATFILLTDSKLFTAMANISYVFGIILILATFVIGRDINGSKSWIPLGFFNLQPIELCKIFTALALAKFLSRPETNFEKSSSQIIAGAIVLTPAALSILQNETGLALVYFAFLIPMYREGLPGIYLIIGFSLAILVVATILVEKNTLAIILTAIAIIMILSFKKTIKRNKSVLFLIIFLWGVSVGIQRFAVPYVFTKVLHPYQVERIMNTFGADYQPDQNAQKLTAEDQKEIEKLNEKKKATENYNVKQSKIAIGSGGFWGKGFLKGTQTQGDFVPEQHTDFIFTSVGENFGFWGSAVVVLLYVLFMLRIVNVAERQRSKFSRVYAYSIAAILFFHVSVNICMTVGLAPVIGITLPLMSYGGSSLLTFTILIFILIRLDADRQMILR
ncbi:MAG: rod shape-determining protein RodA [Chitinophagaceae bacterium]|nr:rod shape-determining protein RodA [Chitinophagaceae bacterium]